MEKPLALFAIIWILSSAYFTMKAIKGDYPIYYGLATATVTTGIGAILGYLIAVVTK